jgi:transposase InsO family protein
LFPLGLPRSYDRLFSSLENIRIRPFKGEAYGTMAITAAAAWFHHTAPRVRNADFANVWLTAHALAERYGFTPPTDGDVARAVEHPEKYWRRLPRIAHRLAADIFQNLHPQAQHPRHIYGVDYSFIPVDDGGTGPIRFVPLLVVLDLYTRFIVAYMMFSRRPRACDFEEVLLTLAAAGLLPWILRIDNEGCFTAGFILRLLQYLDVLVDRIPPGMPQENGATESFFKYFKLGYFPARNVLADSAQAKIVEAIVQYGAAFHPSIGTSPVALASGTFTHPIRVYQYD